MKIIERIKLASVCLFAPDADSIIQKYISRKNGKKRSKRKTLSSRHNATLPRGKNAYSKQFADDDKAQNLPF
jgi:hypothetical protein